MVAELAKTGLTLLSNDRFVELERPLPRVIADREGSGPVVGERQL
jgi:hypothetical protein